MEQALLLEVRDDLLQIKTKEIPWHESENHLKQITAALNVDRVDVVEVVPAEMDKHGYTTDIWVDDESLLKSPTPIIQASVGDRTMFLLAGWRFLVLTSKDGVSHGLTEQRIKDIKERFRYKYIGMHGETE